MRTNRSCPEDQEEEERGSGGGGGGGGGWEIKKTKKRGVTSGVEWGGVEWISMA